MARFTKTVDIWALSPEERSKLQPGQYVKAGPDGAIGRFWGERVGSTVVAWLQNARAARSGDRGGWGYHRDLRAYALSAPRHGAGNPHK